MDSAQYAELFLTESREHVSAMNHALLALEQSGDRGGAAAGDHVSAIFRAVHTVKGMSATMGYTAIAEISHELESLLDALRTFARTSGGMAAVPAPARANLWSVEVPPGDGIGIRVRLVRDTPLRGVRAYLVIEAARKLGTVTAVSPTIAQLQAEQFGDDFALRLVTVDTDAALEALRSAGDVAEVVLSESAPEMYDLLALEHAAPGLVPEGPATASRVQHHVRIDLRRLDALMNLIGELVITRGRLTQLAAATDDTVLAETVAQAGRLVGDLQDEIMQSRMVPVGQVFDRFPRLVRDVARALEKQVEFSIQGKDIELDRSMLDEIGDPVMHLIRNALDHGLESPDVRIARGKPPHGRLTLSAFRDRSAVVIRVEDDGRGIDRARVIARARERGIIHTDGAELTDDDVVKLITRAGFSTADRVTDISGRGVGLDVVTASVRALGGSLDVRSVAGQGTSVTMRLPLTLAIQRSLLARVGGETYALPLTHVSETVELTPGTLQAVKGREVLMLREDVLPVLRLRELVGLPRSGQADPEQVVVLETAERRAALIVDDLTTQQEIVVKQFDGVRDGSTLFGGATILGDGAPALILDVSSLL